MKKISFLFCFFKFWFCCCALLALACSLYVRAAIYDKTKHWENWEKLTFMNDDLSLCQVKTDLSIKWNKIFSVVQSFVNNIKHSAFIFKKDMASSVDNVGTGTLFSMAKVLTIIKFWFLAFYLRYLIYWNATSSNSYPILNILISMTILFMAYLVLEYIGLHFKIPGIILWGGLVWFVITITSVIVFFRVTIRSIDGCVELF